MTLQYLEREAALEEFGEELLPRMKDSWQLRDLYSASETKKYVTEAVSWAFQHGSNTALEIFSFVVRATPVIQVVGMKGGFQCFGTAEGKAKKPVIFLDLDASLNYKTRLSADQHMMSFKPFMRTAPAKDFVTIHYKDVAKNSEHVAPSQFVGQQTELSNRIATLHELGHAKQWIENANLFVRPMSKLREDIRGAAEKFWNKRGDSSHVLKQTDQSPLFTAWDPIVEMDNMNRHEFPICREMGIGYRNNYMDLGGTSGGHNAELAELLRRKMEAEELKAAQAKADPVMDAIKLGSGATHVCPVTKTTITGATRIRSHKFTCPTCRALGM